MAIAALAVGSAFLISDVALAVAFLALRLLAFAAPHSLGVERVQIMVRSALLFRLDRFNSLLVLCLVVVVVEAANAAAL